MPKRCAPDFLFFYTLIFKANYCEDDRAHDHDSRLYEKEKFEDVKRLRYVDFQRLGFGGRGERF